MLRRGKDLTDAIWLILISHFKSNHVNRGKDWPNMIFTQSTIFSYSTFSLITNSCINTIIINHANWGKDLPNIIFTKTTIFSYSPYSLNTKKIIKTIIIEATWLISISYFKSNRANWDKDLIESTSLILISHFKRKHSNWDKDLPNMIYQIWFLLSQQYFLTQLSRWLPTHVSTRL